MSKSHSTYSDSVRRMCTSFALGGAITLVLIVAPADVQANEQILSTKASDPAAAVALLTAPHTGKKICDIADSTPIKFFRHANHGPHRFAKVEVLEGACAGQQGYVPLLSVDPQPSAD